MTPTEIKLHRRSRVLEVRFEDGSVFELPCEYLRVYSPSAEVRGHGAKGPRFMLTNKQGVNIERIEPVGNYAVKLVFDDGHASGLYSFDYLYELGTHQEENWRRYRDALAAVGKPRQ